MGNQYIYIRLSTISLLSSIGGAIGCAEYETLERNWTQIVFT